MSGSEPLTVEPLDCSKHREPTAAITSRNASAERSEGKKLKREQERTRGVSITNVLYRYLAIKDYILLHVGPARTLN